MSGGQQMGYGQSSRAPVGGASYNNSSQQSGYGPEHGVTEPYGKPLGGQGYGQQWGGQQQGYGQPPPWLGGFMRMLQGPYQRPGLNPTPFQGSNPYWQPRPVSMPQPPAQAGLGGSVTEPVMMSQQLQQAQQQLRDSQAQEQQLRTQQQTYYNPYVDPNANSGGV